MDPASLRYRFRPAVAALIAIVACAGGCTQILTTAAILIKGTDVDPEFGGLRGKKVAVVCRPASSLMFGNSTAASDLARQIGIQLRTNVPKIKLVEHQKVAEWADKHEWSEFVEVGKAVKADLVVGIDLQDISIYQSQTLYQGKANLSVAVYDCTDDGKVIFEKALPQMVYPPNSGVPTSDATEAQFRRKFIRVLADQIGRHFYTHDRHAEFISDSDAL
jgi:hypothetical protein